MMRVSFLSLVVIFSSLAVASAGVLLWSWMARRKRDAAMRTHGKPVLVMPIVAGAEVPRAALIRDFQPMRRSPITALAVAERLSPDEYEVSSGSSEESLVTMTTGETVMSDEVAEFIQGQALRFHRPADRSRPFLPGHLLVTEGPDSGLEVRFVRLAHQEESVITFGRSEGPPFRHVQLLEPTVSRAHARMAFDADGWSLTNLSRTNPVVVNRSALMDEQPTLLRDGDRIEMGALVFRYVWR
ncbi:MAG: FHA domain-containing protein [Gemmatimonadetes bacterium]|nr:FHA domain-containing protein [Gemmatimonadota bacterium]